MECLKCDEGWQTQGYNRGHGTSHTSYQVSLSSSNRGSGRDEKIENQPEL